MTPPRQQHPQQAAAAVSAAGAPLQAPPPPAYMAPAKAGPTYKTWSDEEDAVVGERYSCCTRFKFAIWLSVVLLLVAAAVGLSVTMAIVMHNRNKDNPSPAPSPPSDPDNPGGGNGGGSSGDGNAGPLPVPGTPPFDVPSGSQAIWWDEFEGGSLDTGKWSFDLGNGDWGWGNNEMQSYTDSTDNVRVADGNLYITALKDGDSYTSGRINTKQSAGFYPGMQLQDGTTFSSVHVEARMQLPSPGQGLWPAFWMFPTELKYGKWAASGEIDIMESINDFVSITQGIHFGGEDPQNQKNMTRTRQGGKPFSDSFHTMAVDWSADAITVSVDGVAAKTFHPRSIDPQWGWWTSYSGAPDNAPFEQPFYIILNLAVGGLWPDPPDSTTPFPATLTVDYVRVWGTPSS